MLAGEARVRTDPRQPGDELPSERRQQQRHPTLFRTVLIDSEIDGEAAEIINIGTHGFLARTPMLRENGGHVRISLPVAGEREALVVWCGKGMLGGRFVRPVREAILAQLLDSLS